MAKRGWDADVFGNGITKFALEQYPPVMRQELAQAHFALYKTFTTPDLIARAAKEYIRVSSVGLTVDD